MIDRHRHRFNKNSSRAKMREKAVCSLKGLLQGIVADNRLDDLELVFLDAWLKHTEPLIEDPTTQLIAGYVKAALASPNDPMILSRLRHAMDQAIEDLAIGYSGREARTTELLGLLDGVTADTRLVEQEIYAIRKWLDDHPDQLDFYPGSAMATRLRYILADGVVTSEELAEFKDLIKKISGNQREEIGQLMGGYADFLCDRIDELIFPGRCYAFTGKFLSGTRSQMEGLALRRGASIASDITANVDYLVVGMEESRDWRFTSYGRDIEKAMQLKRAGHRILILTEELWTRLSEAGQ